MSEKKIDRKIFITWTLAAVGTTALGCSAGGGSDDGGNGDVGNGGVGGDGQGGTSGGGSGGSSGMSTSGAGGVAGHGGSGGNGGQAAGSGGQAGNGGSGGQIASGGNGGTSGSGGAGGAGGNGNNPDADCSSTINVTITSNHMHTLDIPLADITAAVTKAYETGGAAPHTHWVELTAEDFVALQNGATIRKISCDDQHEHEYFFQCFAATPAQNPGIFDVCFEPATMDCGDLGDNACPTPS